MRAAVLTAPHERLELWDITPAELGPRDAYVRITATGLCHSDLLPIQGELPVSTWPVILGHEGAGVVEAVGAAVTAVKPGDRVVASWVPSCGKCWFCVRGQSQLCSAYLEARATPRAKGTIADGSPVYANGALGTFADLMVASEDALVRVETDLPDAQLALIGCGVATGVCSVFNTAAVEPGATVAVLGCGGVGQSVVQGARIAGASVIVAIDPTPLKRESATRLGATHTIDPLSSDAVEQVKALTGGRGADYAFEVAGRGDTMEQGYQMIRRGGTLVLVGAQTLTNTPGWGAFDQMVNEKTVKGSLGGSAQARRDIPRIVTLIESGQLDVGSMVTRELRLEQVNEGLAMIESGEVIRSVIVN